MGDSSENASAFSSCVGIYREDYSMSCGSSGTGETPQMLCIEELEKWSRLPGNLQTGGSDKEAFIASDGGGEV